MQLGLSLYVEHNNIGCIVFKKAQLHLGQSPFCMFLCKALDGLLLFYQQLLFVVCQPINDSPRDLGEQLIFLHDKLVILAFHKLQQLNTRHPGDGLHKGRIILIFALLLVVSFLLFLPFLLVVILTTLLLVHPINILKLCEG